LNDLNIPGSPKKREFQVFRGMFGGFSSANAMTKPISARIRTIGKTPKYDPVEVLINPASCGPAIPPAP
jgi:hypothetical protein